MTSSQIYVRFPKLCEILKVGALLSFLLFSCQAGASSALSNMFESFAGSTNVTSPGSYSDQAAGYYTGGGFTSRNSSNSLRPLRLSLPHIGSSCRGIDAYFGGFSFVQGEQLVQMIRNMGQQAVSYGFQLALKTMAPQVETLLAQLRKLGLDANKLAIDECNTVQQMFASSLPKGSLAHEQACLDVTSQGGSNDWFGARESCQQDPNQVNQAIDQYKREAPDLLIGEYNLTWEAMKKVPGLTDDIELAQYIMSVVGTLISKKIDPVNHPDKYAVSTKEGKGDSLEFIKSNLEKTSTELLVCDETDSFLARGPHCSRSAQCSCRKSTSPRQLHSKQVPGPSGTDRGRNELPPKWSKDPYLFLHSSFCSRRE